VIESRKEGHVSILILAALYGFEDCIRVLLSWDPSPEQVDLRGNVYNVSGKLVENVTALWCALDRGHYNVASILINEGKANLFFGPNHSRVSYFIETGRLDVIKFLVSNGYVTIERQKLTNDDSYYPYLDLAASLGHTDIVFYFLSQGYERDIRKGFVTNRALHQAAEHGHYDCVRILCNVGLSPRTKDSKGKTALRLAAENNHSDIVDFLLEYNNDETSFNELELLASSYMISTWQFGMREQVDRMRSLLEQSLMKRFLLNIPKEIDQPITAYQFQRECQSIDEFRQIEHNVDRLCLEALLIRERILLPEKNETLLPPLHSRGIILVERGEFDQCFQLWLHTFQLYERIELETDLQNFVWLFCRMLAAGIPISIDQFLEICYLTFHPSQNTFTNERLAAALCLIAIGAKVEVILFYWV
jgi:ankyrin repeat protein